MDCCSKTLFKVSSKFKVQMFKGIHILGLHSGAVAGGERGKWFSSGSSREAPSPHTCGQCVLLQVGTLGKRP